MIDSQDTPLVLAFVRGVSPSTWEQRWNRVRARRRLELLPVPSFGDVLPQDADLVLARTSPRVKPAGYTASPRTHHAVLMYEESVALVTHADHELAGETTISVEDLGLLKLLDYPDHDASWPATEGWQDPTWRPTSVRGALQLVATGVGEILMPMPLARHITDKRNHAVIEVVGDISGSNIFAVWDIDHNTDEMQELIGVLRGRTARSSR